MSVCVRVRASARSLCQSEATDMLRQLKLWLAATGLSLSDFSDKDNLCVCVCVSLRVRIIHQHNAAILLCLRLC